MQPQESSPFPAIYALTWDFNANAPQLEQINTAAGSPVSNHWEDVAFVPAGIAQRKTTLPVANGYRISGAFGLVDDLHAIRIPSPQTALSWYAYNSQTGSPPEARANKGVMTVIEDYIGNHSVMIVLDKSADPSGGSLSLQLAGSGSALSTTYPIFTDENVDPRTYAGGTGVFQWCGRPVKQMAP